MSDSAEDDANGEHTPRFRRPGARAQSDLVTGLSFLKKWGRLALWLLGSVVSATAAVMTFYFVRLSKPTVGEVAAQAKETAVESAKVRADLDKFAIETNAHLDAHDAHFKEQDEKLKEIHEDVRAILLQSHYIGETTGARIAPMPKPKH